MALARAAGLQYTGKLEEVMVLAQLDHSQWSYGLDVYEDPKTRLADLRTKKGATLVYMYARPEDGPTHEGNKQVGFSRRAGKRPPTKGLTASKTTRTTPTAACLQHGGCFRQIL
jgi:hypothetical protein